MKPDTREWNKSSNYDPIDAMEVDGVAWEFLRRNQQYQADYKNSTLQEPEPAESETDGIQSSPDSGIPKKWGLRFCRRSKVDVPAATTVLAP
ncbi:hypothetical protein HGG72_23330 [Ochrobactrum pecoris]|uniref:Transcriptional regulator-like domain-containing protein n=1 Tax=Brucella pecoris TaxID=867683 RepID=A0AB34YYN4_9HYPH|nr:DUF6499 domain-containing protein [Brucella pecoris]MBB4096310.1 hypothetical protein [Brucella pecoris]NKW82562.1 hypothetical protein [Brucella pecoris]